MNTTSHLSLTRYYPLLLIAAGILAYANALDIPFLFDDQGAIVENSAIRRLWPPDWLLSSTAVHAPTNGRPLVSFTFALNHALGGLDPTGYRLFNIAVHILCALALYALIRRTLDSPALADRFADRADTAAFAAALLWLLHPLASQCVDYTNQRTTSLMALFYLITLYATARSAVDPGRWTFVAVLACLFGMASKEVMVGAPLVALLYDRTFHAGSFAAAWNKRKPLYIGLAATWIPLVLLMAAAPHGRSIGFATDVTAWDYLLNQTVVIVAYLQKSLWPHPLVIDYGYPVALSLANVWPQAALLLSLFGLTLYALVRHPHLGFAGLWIFLLLAPTSSVVPIVNEVGAERRFYLPLAVLIALIVVAVHHNLRRSRLPTYTGAVLLLAAALLFGCRTAQRNAEYRDPLTLWRIAVEAVPHNPRGHTYLGLASKAAGRLDEAARHYRIALQLNPDYAEAHANLGILLAESGRIDEAISHFRQAIAAYPDYAETHNNLGNALIATGHIDQAIPHFERALEIRPCYADAHSNLGIAYGSQGHLDQAIAQFEEAIACDPGHVRAHFNLGVTYLNAGRPADAVPPLRRALQLRPDFAAARQSLQAALNQKENR